MTANLKNYKILTLTHRQAKLHHIGKFVLDNVDTDEQLKAQLMGLKEGFELKEIAYLSTCNRVMYFFVAERSLSDNFVKAFFSKVRPDLAEEELTFAVQEAQRFEGSSAINHMYEVASSIDSLVVGEREIMRQLREAFDKCQALGLTGKYTQLLMRHTVEVGREVYTDTKIAEKPVSVVSLTVQHLLQRKVSRDARVLMVGAGQTNTLVGKLMLKHGFHNFAIFNRSIGNAQKLCRMLHGHTSGTLEDLAQYKGGFDVLVVCTSATQAVVEMDLYNALLGADLDNKFVIDLSIPNNVGRDVANLKGVHYTEVEDLRLLAQENMAFRMKEVDNAKAIIDARVDEFGKLLKARQVTSLLSGLPTQVKEVKERALNEIFRDEIQSLDPEAQELLLRVMDYMEKGCISAPMKAAREAAMGVA